MVLLLIVRLVGLVGGLDKVGVVYWEGKVWGWERGCGFWCGGVVVG